MKKLLSIAFLSLAIFGKAGLAQEYPIKPIKVVVPYAPGGPSDIFARILFQKITELSGKSFIIENKPGASANWYPTGCKIESRWIHAAFS